jgi:hypothetical protein
VSFIKRAQQAAEAAAATAQQAAEAARLKAGEVGRTATDPAMHERLGRQAKETVAQARRGVATVVERIDPGTLAEVIIKATSLQEKTNAALRARKSPYRVSEIAISASVPPGITFSITRIDEGEVLSGQAVTSAELIEALPDLGEGVFSLDGTTDDPAIEVPEGAT